MATRIVVIGTNDLVGAVVTGVSSDEIYFEKDGRTLHAELEYEYWYNTCMCEETCYCYGGDRSAYLVARERVEVPDKKPRGKKK